MEFLSQPGVILDLVLLAVVLLFAVLGARRGLVLSLCSLVAVVVALIGATLISDALTPLFSAQAAPMLEGFLQTRLNEWLASGSQALAEADGFLAHMAGSVLQNQDWAGQTGTVLPEFALAVTQAILRPILFVIAFVLLLILWHFISRALDLVARLPVLSTLNTAGGFLLGAVKGTLVLLVLFLLLRTFCPGLIPADLLAASRILSVIQKAPALVL